MAKQKKTDIIISLFEEARRGYELVRDDFVLLENGYLNILPEEKIKDLKKRGKSVITPRKIYSKIRRMVISIMKTYFENGELAKLSPTFPTDENKDNIAKLQKAFNNWVETRINIYTRIRPIVRDALVYGTGCAKVYWSNGLRIERVKPLDFWLDPNAENIFDIQYMVNRVYTTVASLKSQYGNKKVFKNFVGAQIENDEIHINQEDLGDFSRIEVYDIYRKINGQWYVSTMLPDYSFVRVDVKLKDGLPFVFGITETQFTYIGEKTVKALGYPIIDLMIPLQEQYTITTNQQIDAIDKQLNPQFLATKQSGLNENTLRSNKKLLQVVDLNNIKELPQPNINQSLMTTENIDLDMQEISGISKMSQGLMQNGQNTTATGMTILTQEANEVVADIISSLNESFFEPLIRRMVLLISKYDDSPFLYDYNRNGKFDFSVKINTGVGATNKETQLQAITTAEQTAIQSLQMAMQMQDIQSAKIYRDILNKLFIEKLGAIGLNNIQNDMKGMLENELQQQEQQQSADANFGGAGTPEPQVAGNQANQGDISMGGNAAGAGQPVSSSF